MRTSQAADLRRKIAGICLIVAPILLLAGDALRIGADRHYAWFIMGKLAFAFFVPAILAIVHLLSKRADRTGLLGGGLALAGCLAGVSILTASMIYGSLDTAGFDEPASRAIEAAMLKGGVREYVLLYPLPGLAFPTGLLILSFGLLRAKAVSPLAAGLLALGAVLFPIGRIGEIAAAMIASDVALSVAMGLIGWQVLRWTAEEWEHVPTFGAETVALEGEKGRKPDREGGRS